MADDAHTEAQSEETQPAEDAQPETLRVQAQAEQPDEPDPGIGAQAASAEVEARPSSAEVDGDEPESRLMLETVQDAPERADYQPLFMAPQPIQGRVRLTHDDDDDEDDDAAMTPARTPTMTSPTSRPPGVGVVDAVDVVEVAASRTVTTPTTAIPVTIRTTPMTPTIPMTPMTTTVTTTVRAMTAPRVAAGAGDAASPAPAMTARAASSDDPPNTVVHEREPRKSGRGDKSSNPVTGKFRASTDRPGWRPSGSAVVTVVTPAVAVRRS